MLPGLQNSSSRGSMGALFSGARRTVCMRYWHRCCPIARRLNHVRKPLLSSAAPKLWRKTRLISTLLTNRPNDKRDSLMRFLLTVHQFYPAYSAGTEVLTLGV